MNEFQQIKIVNFLIQNHKFAYAQVQPTNGDLLLLGPQGYLLISKAGSIDEIHQIATILEQQKILGSASKLSVIHKSIELHDTKIDVCWIDDHELNKLYPKLSSINFDEGSLDQEQSKNITLRKKYVQKKLLNQIIHNNPITLGLSCFMIIVFIFQLWIQQFQRYDTTWLIVSGGMYAPFIQGAHEYFRLITSGFVHGSIMHLLVNLLSFINLGTLIESRLKKRQYIMLILLSIFVGSSVSYLGNEVLSVGFSGALYGLLGYLLVFLYHSGLFKIPQVRNQIISFVLMNAWINLLPNISWLAHLGGFVTGVLCGLLFLFKPNEKIKFHAKVSIFILVVSLVGMMVVKPKLTQLYVGSDLDAIEVTRSIGLDFYGSYLESKMFEYYQKGE